MYKLIQAWKVATVMAATGCIAAAASIDPSYLPSGVNVRRRLMQGSSEWRSRVWSASNISIGSAVSAGFTIVANTYTRTQTTWRATCVTARPHLRAMSPQNMPNILFFEHCEYIFLCFFFFPSTTTTTITPVQLLLFQDNLGKPVPER